MTDRRSGGKPVSILSGAYLNPARPAPSTRDWGSIRARILVGTALALAAALLIGYFLVTMPEAGRWVRDDVDGRCVDTHWVTEDGALVLESVHLCGESRALYRRQQERR